jgi:hypothetical protein
MNHRLPPIDRDPEIGDLCRIGGAGTTMPRKFFKKHGPGMIVKRHIHQESRTVHYEVKWLKSDERMRFLKEDLIIISNVNVDR